MRTRRTSSDIVPLIGSRLALSLLLATALFGCTAFGATSTAPEDARLQALHDRLSSVAHDAAESQRAAAAIRVEDLKAEVQTLASDRMNGRLTGTLGEREATEYAAGILKEAGLQPAGERHSYFESFDFIAGVSLGTSSSLTLTSPALSKPKKFELSTAWVPLAFSAEGKVAPTGVVFAGYGITSPATTDQNGTAIPGYDSYAHLDVRDKWVLVFRHFPDKAPETLRKNLAHHASLRYKAMLAREHGARGLIIVSGPMSEVKNELVALEFDAAQSESNLAAISVTDEVADELLAGTDKTLARLQIALETGAQQPGFAIKDVALEADIHLVRQKLRGQNVLATLPKTEPSDLPAIIIGAHIDHLGRGKTSASLARGDDIGKIHYGADDNASGVAAALEIAQYLGQKRRDGTLHSKRDLIVALWSGEELGLLGSNYFVHHFPGKKPLHTAVGAYLNMDMVGRLQSSLILQGIGSSSIWPGEIQKANTEVNLPLTLEQESYLPTDATSFYLLSVPILSAFTGAHEDYHTPRDTADKLNYEGLAKVARLMERLTEDLLSYVQPIDYKKMERPAHYGERAYLRATLGTIPDYASPNIKGLKIAGVSAGGPADSAGIQAGDVVVELNGKQIQNIYDYTYAIEALKVNEEVPIAILRAGKRLDLKVTPVSRE